MGAPGSLEAEIALVIAATDPRAVAEEIASLPGLADYRFVPHAPQPIRDRYLDTADRALAARHLALRIRTIGTVQWLTVKGPSAPTPWGGAERLELETPWSAETLSAALDALRRAGLALPFIPLHAVTAPLETMRRLGLHVVQDRETHRRPRGVVREAEPAGPVLAELAVDAVVFRTDHREVRLYDVEIEAKAPDGPAAAQSVTHALASRYAEALRRWPYGKLATGDVIERLLAEGTLHGLLAPDGALTPAAYDALERVLVERG